MATIVTRAGKGSALTFQEADDNFTNLNADGTANAASITTLTNDKLDKSGGVMTGALTVNANLVAGGKVLGSVSNNSQSGSTVTLTAPSSEIVRLTNVLLVSVSGIAAGSNGQKLVLVNRSGTTVSIENESSSASAADQIYTGSGAPLSLNDKASISLLYDGTTSRWNIIGGTGSATGSGGINYILNGDASIGTTGWNAYNDGAVAAPVDGSGGTPAAGLWVRSTTDPLRGSGDFNLVKTGSTSYQGQGVSYDFTIDLADQAKILTISADFEVVSGTYVTGDLTAYIIQDPSGTPVVVQPAGFQFESATIGNKVRLAATFQTASNVTNYRLCFHIATTSALDYTLALDTISVSPQQVVYGAPVTDWQSYTPAFTGFGSVGSSSMFWRRSGDSLEIKGRFTSGTSTATEARVSFPPGLSSDSSKVSTIEICGSGEINSIGSIGQNVGASYAVLSEPSVGYVTFSARSSGTTGLSKLNGNTTISSGGILTLEAKVPIAGWSSSVVVSSSTDTRVVAAKARRSANQVIAGSTATIIQFNVSEYDTHGTFNTGTYTYTIPVAGIYEISGQFLYGGVPAAAGYDANIRLYLNGADSDVQGAANPGTVAQNVIQRFLFRKSLNAGDTIAIRAFHGVGAGLTLLGDSSALGLSTLQVVRLSGPSQIAASETVAASYQTASSTALTGGTAIRFTSSLYDTHGAYNSATGAYVAPIPGIYRLSMTGLYATGAQEEFRLEVNGVIRLAQIGTIVNGIRSTLVASAKVNAGDSITIVPTSAGTLGDTAGSMAIERIGN